MNSKIIREGNAFYETDDLCMQKKEKKNSNYSSSNSFNNTTARKQSNIFSYKFPTK